jgi:hypothetical protein
MFAMRLRAVIAGVVLSSSFAFAQNWKQVHKKDEEKWAKTTGLDPSVIHKLWHGASRAADEKDDDSRIADINLDGLAERHDLLLVTYAGEKNCLTLTVFRQFSESKFEKIWSTEQPPDGTGFCDNSLGSAKAYAENGAVLVRVPPETQPNAPDYVLYRYEWNGITYRLAEKKDVQGNGAPN